MSTQDRIDIESLPSVRKLRANPVPRPLACAEGTVFEDTPVGRAKQAERTRLMFEEIDRIWEESGELEEPGEAEEILKAIEENRQC